MRISVIIPTLNEAASIGGRLASLLLSDVSEIIVADGGSTDGTVAVAEGQGARIISTPPGRARQMNRAAEAATGDILLFLHADTVLPDGFETVTRRILSDKRVAAGAFRLVIDSPRTSARIVEWLTHLRCALSKMPYGDQAIFCRREEFGRVGGYPDMPIMEDYELVRRLKRLGRMVVASECVTTSARRWERLGVIRTTLINQLVIIGYHIGVSHEKLKRLYRGRPDTGM